ncbi:MAG: outer membrane protein OmpA-like peptidoglycan-associated protein [Myxococcota bacterium]|jgi:outer membrane protein OmpA-like peptidoglycan-associated protein
MKRPFTLMLAITATTAFGCAGNYTAPAGPRALNSPVDRKVNVSVDESLVVACGITVPHVFFDSDSTELEDSFKGTLREVATCVTNGKLAGERVGLVGHADPKGAADYNRKLARERAQRVAQFLSASGVSEGQLIVRSHGETEARNTLPDTAFNRRTCIHRPHAQCVWLCFLLHHGSVCFRNQSCMMSQRCAFQSLLGYPLI